MVRRSKIWLIAAVVVLLSRPIAGWAAPSLCPQGPSDVSQVGAARSSIESTCLCAAFDGTAGKKHFDYLRCARQIVNTRVDAGQLRHVCGAKVLGFYKNSACGYRFEEFRAPCIVTSNQGTKIQCSIQKQNRCHGFTPTLDRVACFESPHCIDVADTNNDLTIEDAGDTGHCSPTSFTDNGDGTISDNLTGLMWEKKSDDAGLFDQDVKIHDKDNLYTWTPGQGSIFEWIDAVNAEGGTGFAGHNDWRIPTIEELRTLILRDAADPTVPDPAIDPAFNTTCTDGCTVLTCSCTAPLGYWSATTRSAFPTPPGHPTNAWGVDFYAGDVGYSSLTSVNPVRAVRGVRKDT